MTTVKSSGAAGPVHPPVVTPIPPSIVQNFSAAFIDNDGKPYFEFAASYDRKPDDPGYPGPQELVYYRELKDKESYEIARTVMKAWAQKSRPYVQIELDANFIPQAMRVKSVTILKRRHRKIRRTAR